MARSSPRLELRYVPASVVRHRHAQSSGVWSPTFRYYTERNRPLVLAKNAPLGVAARAGGGWLAVRCARTVRDVLPASLAPRHCLNGSRRRMTGGSSPATCAVVPGMVRDRMRARPLVDRPRAHAMAAVEADRRVNRSLRVGVYDLYWSTLGGGEQVAGTLASVLADDHDVTLLGPAPLDVELTKERLGIDLGRCAFRLVHDDAEASAASVDFDLFVNVTYCSTAINHAACGWYYVHFPGQPPTSRDRLRQWTSVNAASLLDRPGLPPRLAESKPGSSVECGRPGTLRPTTAIWPTPTSRRTGSGGCGRFRARCSTRRCAPCRRADRNGRWCSTSVDSSILASGTPSVSSTWLTSSMTFDLDGWELALAGGCDAANRDYALAVRRAAVDKPIHVHVNARGAVVSRLITEASIYWHASGYGADPKRHPERFEHFGITVVEAMAAGAVPLVYGAGGPAEIVTHGVDGCHWHDLDELATLTTDLAREPGERGRLADSARQRAQEFSVGRFAEEVRGLIDKRPVQ